VFDYGVAFTGFSRVVYSPMFVLGVAFTGFLTWLAPRIIAWGIRIQNPDPDWRKLEEGRVRASSRGQGDFDLVVCW
jgi:hypothetical protein